MCACRERLVRAASGWSGHVGRCYCYSSANTLSGFAWPYAPPRGESPRRADGVGESGVASIASSSIAALFVCPAGVSPGKNALLHGTTAAFTSTTEPATLLCCASSSHRIGLDMRFLFIGPPLSSSLPPPGQLPFRSWLRVVVMLSCSHEWFSYKRLSLYLQRAHAGRTQANPAYRREDRLRLISTVRSRK
jgi:hypothetical protein